MNILGFNPSHHGSVCLLQNGEIKYFIQEEKLTKSKYDAFPFKSFIDILQNHQIDAITWSSPSILYPIDSSHLFSNFPYWTSLASKYFPNLNSYNYSSYHHLSHAAHAFYNSKFKKAISIVIDGLGSVVYNKNGDYCGQETETIFKCSYPSNFEVLYRNYCNIEQKEVNLSQTYETITKYLGWSINEAGKTMGLSSYGRFNKNFPKFFTDNISNPEIFSRTKDSNKQNSPYFINDNPVLQLSRDPKEWHYTKSKITNTEKDLAWKIQNDTQQLVGDYVENIIEKTGLKQICCSGGYFLNCVANYYLTKRFPDIEFYFEPVANDAGTAIGAAKLLWHQQTQDTTIRPFKSLYLGKQYSKDKLMEGIKKYT